MTQVSIILQFHFMSLASSILLILSLSLYLSLARQPLPPEGSGELRNSSCVQSRFRCSVASNLTSRTCSARLMEPYNSHCFACGIGLKKGERRLIDGLSAQHVFLRTMSAI